MRVLNLRYLPIAGPGVQLSACQNRGRVLTADRDADVVIVGIKDGDVDVGGEISALQRGCEVGMPAALLSVLAESQWV